MNYTLDKDFAQVLGDLVLRGAVHTLQHAIDHLIRDPLYFDLASADACKILGKCVSEIRREREALNR
ncbi:MAG: hypothetical protein ACXAEN_22405 [Candidatus Thorarchaeota archaeon]|jgi:hypothetical protein